MCHIQLKSDLRLEFRFPSLESSILSINMQIFTRQIIMITQFFSLGGNPLLCFNTQMKEINMVLYHEMTL